MALTIIAINDISGKQHGFHGTLYDLNVEPNCPGPAVINNLLQRAGKIIFSCLELSLNSQKCDNTVPRNMLVLPDGNI